MKQEQGLPGPQHYVLCISLRGSQRVPTQFGSRLDEIRDVEPDFGRLHAWLRGCAKPPGALDALLEAHGATGALRRQVGEVFELHAAGEPASRTVRLDVDGVHGDFSIAGLTAWLGSHRTMEGTEGEDLVFALPLRPEADRAAGGSEGALVLDRRPPSASAAADWLRRAGALPASAVPRLQDRLRAGFYILPVDAPRGDQGWTACCCIVAYLFRCYLACQRAERLLAEVRSNGDWDEEYRKLLLVRKKLVTVRKNALLKNRAVPGSPLLPCFHAALAVLRLQEQADHLGRQVEDAGKVLEAQSLYVAARRIQTIQAIAFASTVLGLAVALNAIQMPPFYEASAANALHRPVFWIVVAAVVVAGLLTWMAINHWWRVRRLWRGWRRDAVGEAP